MEKSDGRGSFVGITQGTWSEVNFVTSHAGTVWGNHYHSRALERFFLVRGSVRVEIRNVETGAAGEEVFRAGDIFEIEPKELHIFHVLEESSWVNMYDRSDVDFIRPES
jgi:dTDP-4-dehydrorhamnose 3,5-epimerase-like enzyme